MDDMKHKVFLLLAFCTILVCQKTWAGVDPVRAALIDSVSRQAKKTIEAQEKAQTRMTAWHIMLKEEEEATTDFQREFNDYLDNFHDLLSVAAEIYGLYYEVTQTTKTLKGLKEVLADSPQNALAVAFSAKSAGIYRNVVKTGLDVIMDVRKVCLESSKMTQQERNKVVSSIRPKLRAMNGQLRRLTMALRYTSFIDVWNEITGRAYQLDKKKRADIIKECRREWWDRASRVR